MSQRCFPHLQFSVLYINVNQIDSCPFRGAIASFLRVSVFASCVLELMPKWRAVGGAKMLAT